MMSMLDWVNTDELLPLIALSALLVFIGQQLGASDARAKNLAARCCVVAFFAYAALAIANWGVYAVSDLLIVVFRAMLGAPFQLTDALLETLRR